MFVPLAESAGTVNGALVNAAGTIITVGGLALTLAWAWHLYQD